MLRPLFLDRMQMQTHRAHPILHWIDETVEKVRRERPESRYVVESGTSISGEMHIGNACDLIISQAAVEVMRDLGVEAEHYWVADDFDPLRKVPKPLPDDFKKFLGVPVDHVPDPLHCCRNMTEHFTKPFLEALEKVGVYPKKYYGSEMYRTGMYGPYIRTALLKAKEIRDILRRISGSKKRDDWLPFDPICRRCGNIATTRALTFDGDSLVHYVCEGAEVSRGLFIHGCGYEGDADIMKGEGKLTWRVEWAARWALFKVGVEPFGKEHAAAGGSYDTSSVICREIFGWNPPFPIRYEHILFGGRKMSKSAGLVFSPSKWMEVAPPETLRYFFFRVHPMKHNDFDPTMIPVIVENYDRLERIYFGREKAGEEEIQRDRRVYELSQTDSPPDSEPVRIPYDLAVLLVQITPDMEAALERALLHLAKIRGLSQTALPQKERQQLAERLKMAKAYVEKYMPDSEKFRVLDRVTDEVRKSLDSSQRAGLRILAQLLRSAKGVSAVQLHNEIYRISREVVRADPSKLFEAIYLSISGATSGPRAGYLLETLDRDWLIQRFEEASES